MLEPANLAFDQIELGQCVEFEVMITEDMVKKFSELSGDTNPLHMDHAFASKTPYGQRIAHGMLGASFFSALVGMRLPGLNSVYLSQSLFFRNPIRLNAKAIVRGTIIQKIESMRTVKISTVLLDLETSLPFLDGEALVKLLA